MTNPEQTPPESPSWPEQALPEIPTKARGCDTARMLFNCLDFPLENFTKGNQKTARIERPTEELPEQEMEARNSVNEVLARAWTEKGVEVWWDRPRYELDNRTPNEVWAEDPEQIMNLAIKGLDQGSS